MEYECDKIAAEYLTADAAPIMGPLRLYSVTVNARGAAATCDIYEGMNTSGRVIAKLDVASGNFAQWFSAKGLRLDRGVYFDIGGAGTSVTYEWEPVEV